MLYSMQMQNIKPLISNGRLIQRLFRRTDVCPWFFKALEGFGHSKEHVGAESSPFSQAALSAEQYIPCFRSVKADRILEIASKNRSISFYVQGPRRRHLLWQTKLFERSM